MSQSESLCNLGSAEVERRRNFGLWSAGGAVAWGVVLITGGFSPYWNLTIFLPLWGAALGLLQAWEKT